MRGKQAYRSEFVGTQEWLVARAARNWPSMIFLIVWLSGWTLGGLVAMAILFSGYAPEDAEIFLGIWLCGWTLGMVFAGGRVLWQLFGKMRLTVESDLILYERRVPGLRKMQEFEISKIGKLRPRKNGVEFDYEARTITIMSVLNSKQSREVIDWLTRRAPRGSFGT